MDHRTNPRRIADRATAHRGVRVAYAHLLDAADKLDVPIGHPEPNGVLQFDALILWDLAETMHHELDRIAYAEGRPGGLPVIYAGHISRFARTVHHAELTGAGFPVPTVGRAVNYATEVAQIAAGWAARAS